MRLPDQDIQDKLQNILATKTYTIPDGDGFEGSGAPGMYLEHLLGLRTSNEDIPDTGQWEVKYTSETALITMFHKDPFPRSGQAMRYMINNWGWIGSNGCQSFRHTICGESSDFEVVDESNSIRVRHRGHDDFVPHWPHDVLLTTFARKMGNLILVRGNFRRYIRRVRYNSAEYLTNPRITKIIRALLTGKICIDFDAFIRDNNTIRNHGTKFRIKVEDLPSLYHDRQIV